MPGFCGYVGTEWDTKGRKVVDDMCRMLVHTGDHQVVRFVSEGMSMAVLTRPDALSPIPFVDDDAGLATLLEGEVYNLEEVIESLLEEGTKFRSGSPQEVLHLAYQAKGAGLGLYLSGAFNVFLWDKSLEKLTIINDRAGLRPLYYASVGGSVYFTSEVKALLAVTGLRLSLDDRFLYQFLTYGFPLGETTIAREVSLLPIATIAEIEKGDIKLIPYWRPEQWPERTEKTLKEAVDGFVSVFSKAQSRVLRGNQKKGILLSGGIDSRIVAAGAVKNDGEFPTFTFGEEGCNDSRIAGRVAGQLGLSNTFFPIGPDYLTRRAIEACWLTDGMYNVFHAHGVSVYADIAQQVQVILSGMEQVALHLYGEEIWSLPGWSEDMKTPEALFQYMYQEPSVPVFDGKDGILTEAAGERVAGEVRHVQQFLSGSVIVHSSGEIDPLRTLEWMGLRNRQRRFVLMGQLLIRNWLEVRAPLMDPDVILYAMSLNDDYRAEDKPLHIGWLDAVAPGLLKIAWQRTGIPIKSTVLDSFVAAGRNWFRRKAGNCYSRISGVSPTWAKKKLADYHMWLVHDSDLQKYVKAVLLSPRTMERGIFRDGEVRRILEAEFTDREVHTELIGRMVTLELAIRLFFDGEERDTGIS